MESEGEIAVELSDLGPEDFLPPPETHEAEAWVEFEPSQSSRPMINFPTEENEPQFEAPGMGPEICEPAATSSSTEIHVLPLLILQSNWSTQYALSTHWKSVWEKVHQPRVF